MDMIGTPITYCDMSSATDAMVVSAIFTIIINSPTQRKSETIDRSFGMRSLVKQNNQRDIYLNGHIMHVTESGGGYYNKCIFVFCAIFINNCCE